MSKENVKDRKEKCELELLIEKLRQQRHAQGGMRDKRLAVTGQLKENLGNAKEANTNA